MICTRLSLSVIAFACSVLAQGSPSRSVTERPRLAIDAISEYVEGEMAAHAIPGLSIAVLSRGKLVWSAGFGHADRAKTQAATGQTVYRTASIAKLFTTVAVMQLCERGLLDLDRPVRECLAEFRPVNPYGDAITLRHLLSHFSGLHREPLVGHYFEAGDSLSDLVRSLSGRPLVYAPGSRFKYSNAGVSVAGYAVEKVAKRAFTDQMQEAVIDYLGLKQSSFAADSEVARSCAEGWMWTMDGRSFAAPTFVLGMEPAANLYSSVEDLVRFAGACSFDAPDERRLLSQETLTQIYTEQFAPESGIGVGFFVDRLHGKLRVGHSGGVYGFSSRLEFLPREGLAVAVALTLDACNGVTSRIAEVALRMFMEAREGRVPERIERPQAIGVKRARALAGRYGDAWNWIELRERAGDLIEIPAAGTPTIYRDLKGRLVGDGRLTRSWSGRVLKVVERGVERDGRFMPKLVDTCPPESPQRYHELLGEYGWDHGTLYILEDGGRLCCLIEWFSRCLLAEYDKDRFVMPNDGLYRGETLRFERDRKGGVSAVTVGGVRFPRRRVGPADGVTFKIKALYPPERLRAMAREARMPKQKASRKPADLVDLKELDASIHLDVRYATKNNFMNMVFYDQPKALMQRPAAAALLRVHQKLAKRGFGVTVHDAYRPWAVTKMFWDATPKSMKDFVANPARGSRHNRGCAVDLTLHKLGGEEAVSMVSGYDEFTERAYPDYPGGTSRQRWFRETLRAAMEAEGFSVYKWEWWHFDFGAWREYPVMNQPFR